jgi:uncharacterized protein YjbI with pentapeptide repeats
MPLPIAQAEFEDRLRAGQEVDLRKNPNRHQPIPASWIENLCPTNTPVPFAVTISGAILEGDCRLSYRAFQQPVLFTECEFRGAVYLEFATFHQNSGFHFCMFRQGVLARHLSAESDLGFCLSRADRAVQLDAAEVKGDFDARGAKFQGMSLVRGKIGGSVLFTPFDRQSRPDLPAELPVWNEAEFAGSADLAECTVGRDARFWGARLSAETRLTSARIGGNIEFGTPDASPGQPGRAAYSGSCQVTGSINLVKCSGQLLDLSNIKLRSIDLSAASFSQVDCSDSVFFETADFTNSSLGDVTFAGARFAAWTPPGAVAPVEADFKYASFKAADFRSTRFERAASFQFATFAEPALFRGDDGNPSATFASAADFTGGSMRHADFTDVTFEGDLRMPLLSVPGLAQFCASKFRGISDFTQATFGSAVFTGATFARTADFTGVKFGSADFYGQDHPNPAQFDRICLSGSEFTRISIDPDAVAEKQLPLDFQPILRLEQSLQQNGDERKAQDLYYRFCVRRNREKRSVVLAGLKRMAKLEFKNDTVRAAFREFLPYVEDCLFRFVCRYGVRPYRLAVCWVVLLIIGTCVLSRPGMLALKDDKSGIGLPPVGLPAAFGQTLSTLLPGVSLAVGQRYVPTQAPVTSLFSLASVEAFVSILQLAAWILVPIGVLSLSGLLHRKKS